MVRPDTRISKVIGMDFELANAVMGRSVTPPSVAAKKLLTEIPGHPSSPRSGTAIEYGRRFLDTCGSSWYIDSDHLEGNLPEHLSAVEHANVLHGAGFHQARLARQAAQASLPAGSYLNVLANCSDGKTAWGSHLNILVSRECFDNLLFRKPHLAGFWSTHLVTSVLYTGQGLVGAGNGRSPCGFQLSQRADWFEKLTSIQTMFERPLINLRDESHASDDLARLHVIFFDMVLSPIANILKAGTAQLVLAMIEAGWVDPTLCLDDPVGSASEISRDLKLTKKLRTTVRGRLMSAWELQKALADLACEFVRCGEAAPYVPDAEEIVALWFETLDMLQQHDIDALAGRCDAWMKYSLLDHQRGRRNLSWASDEIRVADSLFASIDPQQSLFFDMAEGGFIERMPDADVIARYAFEPPDETRAYFRAHALRRFGQHASSIDWSRMVFRVPGARHWWSIAEVPMGDPRRLGRSEAEPIFDQCSRLEDLVDAANSIVERQPAAMH